MPIRDLVLDAPAPILAVAGLAVTAGACGGDANRTAREPAATVCEPADSADDPGRHGDDATRIVLLGTSHFAGSLTDEHTSEVGDILSERRQRELDTVAARLASWGTDEVFVECTPDEQDDIDSRYAAYRAGDFDPTAAGERNEIVQLGFRTARRAGVSDVACVDASGVWLGSRAREVAREHAPALIDGLDTLHEARLDDAAYLADHTLRDYLLALNSERALWSNHKAYVYYYARMGSFDGAGTAIHREGDLGGATFALADDVPESMRAPIRAAVKELGGGIVTGPGATPDYVVTARRDAASAGAGSDTLSLPDFRDLVQQRSETFVGFPDHHIGADLVGEWYKRNLRTYANIWRAVGEGDERIVVLIGQGHVWSLRTFLRENPEFDVVPVEEVLL